MHVLKLCVAHAAGDKEEHVPEVGLRGTSWMAAQVSSRPELSLADVAVPMDTAEDMMRVFMWSAMRGAVRTIPSMFWTSL